MKLTDYVDALFESWANNRHLRGYPCVPGTCCLDAHPDVLTGRMSVETDGIGYLDIHNTVAAFARNPQHMLGDFGQPTLLDWDVTGSCIGARIVEHGFPIPHRHCDEIGPAGLAA